MMLSLDQALDRPAEGPAAPYTDRLGRGILARMIVISQP
jgi:hypothetical protein